MATLRININDALKYEADKLFSGLGLDTATAIRIFLTAAIEQAGIPFAVRHQAVPASLQEAIEDSRERKNLYGPFDTANEAVTSMLEE